jgi:uncharacterized membrane protein (UPF0136 family)
MKLMHGEKVLREAGSNGLIVTTHRIRLEKSSTGFRQIKSIMLEEIASCEVKRTSDTSLIVLAVLFVAGGLLGTMITQQQVFIIIGGLLGIIGLCWYFVSRKQSLIIKSAGESIQAGTQGIGVGGLRDIIDTVEAAKNTRLHNKDLKAS